MTDLHRVLDETTQLIRAGRYLDALVVLEAALLEYPYDGKLLRKLAWTHLHLHDHAKANAVLKRIEPRNGQPTALLTEAPTSLSGPLAEIEYDHDQVSPEEYAALVGRSGEEPVGDGGDRSGECGNRDGYIRAESPLPQEVGDEAILPDFSEALEVGADDASSTDEQANDLVPESSSAFEDVSAALTQDGPPHLESVWSLETDGVSEEISEAVQSLHTDPIERVERRVRATQQARALLASFGYDTRRHVRAFTDIFFRFGWSRCKATVADCIKRGYYPEEIHLAFRIRIEWAGCTEFTEYVYSPWNGERRSYPGAAILGWGLALDIIRAFDGLPTLSEVRIFLDREFDAWSGSPALQEEYKSFPQYLTKCRLDGSGRNLPSREQRHFERAPDVIGFDPEWDDRTGYDPIPNAAGRDLLLALVDRFPLRDNLFER